jgi:hypothetical protein
MEDLLCMAPLAFIAYQFVAVITPSRHELLALPADQHALILPSLERIGDAHWKILAAWILVFLIQVGAQRTLLLKEQLMQQASAAVVSDGSSNSNQAK